MTIKYEEVIKTYKQCQLIYRSIIRILCVRYFLFCLERQLAFFAQKIDYVSYGRPFKSFVPLTKVDFSSNDLLE